MRVAMKNGLASGPSLAGRFFERKSLREPIELREIVGIAFPIAEHRLNPRAEVIQEEFKNEVTVEARHPAAPGTFHIKPHHHQVAIEHSGPGMGIARLMLDGDPVVGGVDGKASSVQADHRAREAVAHQPFAIRGRLIAARLSLAERA